MKILRYNNFQTLPIKNFWKLYDSIQHPPAKIPTGIKAVLALALVKFLQGGKGIYQGSSSIAELLEIVVDVVDKILNYNFNFNMI